MILLLHDIILTALYSCVLIGMRAPAYVDDALGILSWPPLPDVRLVYAFMGDVALPA